MHKWWVIDKSEGGGSEGEDLQGMVGDGQNAVKFVMNVLGKWKGIAFVVAIVGKVVEPQR